jgi:hypothetical protein
MAIATVKWFGATNRHGFADPQDRGKLSHRKRA